jgi:hypothetical protein
MDDILDADCIDIKTTRSESGRQGIQSGRVEWLNLTQPDPIGALKRVGGSRTIPRLEGHSQLLAT